MNHERVNYERWELRSRERRFGEDRGEPSEGQGGGEWEERNARGGRAQKRKGKKRNAEGTRWEGLAREGRGREEGEEGRRRRRRKRTVRATFVTKR